jgi:hypothetical protein
MCPDKPPSCYSVIPTEREQSRSMDSVEQESPLDAIGTSPRTGADARDITLLTKAMCLRKQCRSAGHPKT